MLQVKQGVRFKTFSPVMLWMLNALYLYSRRVSYDIVITSANDGHVLPSRHVKDEALDIRSKNIPSSDEKLRFIDIMHFMLGPYVTIILEDENKDNEHFHMQAKKGSDFPGILRP